MYAAYLLFVIFYLNFFSPCAPASPSELISQIPGDLGTKLICFLFALTHLDTHTTTYTYIYTSLHSYRTRLIIYRELSEMLISSAALSKRLGICSVL